MNVVDLRIYREPAFTPLLILVDPQREYLAKNRALGLPDATTAIANCRTLLAFARNEGLPVAFMRWRQKGKFFGQGGDFSDWIEELSPVGSDMIFDRSLPSCYASRDFAEMMDRGGGDNAIVAGFTGTISCLSTVVDGFHRQHSLTFIADASASHATHSSSQDIAHQFVSELIALYCPVVSTARWIAQQAHVRRPRIGAANE